MTRIQKAKNWWLVAVPLLLRCVPVPAQTSAEFFPEIDANVRLNSNTRFVFQAKETREGGESTQAELGPSLEFSLKPLIKLKDITIFDLDDAKSRPLIFAIGYRLLLSPDKPATQRMEPAVISHFPLKAKILVTDRNRADLDWNDGHFTWRYRNRLTLERSLTIRSYHPAPYVSAEFFYQSEYSKWSSTNLFAGCMLPLSKHLQLDPYYEHENNTGKHPNQQVDAGGLILAIYF